jgi:hypothetical protein
MYLKLECSAGAAAVAAAVQLVRRLQVAVAVAVLTVKISFKSHLVRAIIILLGMEVLVAILQEVLAEILGLDLPRHC